MVVRVSFKWEEGLDFFWKVVYSVSLDSQSGIPFHDNRSRRPIREQQAMRDPGLTTRCLPTPNLEGKRRSGKGGPVCQPLGNTSRQEPTGEQKSPPSRKVVDIPGSIGTEIR